MIMNHRLNSCNVLQLILLGILPDLLNLLRVLVLIFSQALLVEMSQRKAVLFAELYWD